MNPDSQADTAKSMQLEGYKLVPDPLAETTAELFGYIALGREGPRNNSGMKILDRQIIEQIFGDKKIIPFKKYGRSGDTGLYYFGAIDDRLEDITNKLREAIPTERTRETIITDVRSYFTAGDQCGYNPQLWKPEDQKTKFQIAVGLRKAVSTVEQRLREKKVRSTPDGFFRVSDIAEVFYLDGSGKGDLKRPKPVYKPTHPSSGTTL